ncbi:MULTISPECIES: hypothetical protein [unclassified Streptomyces]|uniref:hypothetical protein n=1 Tax=unclassified Streptomyces TaxID=2593676 RepID=UPI00225986F7|nr:MULTISPECIES: hypothetical protein [unclassified Streptomyces]MCX4548564.1 hypothetical protein [Streptomyces sp. NBC_01500]WSC20175.1 hypothetical protein OIE60_11025 [Streptomyces sp. NBC_01766]
MSMRHTLKARRALIAVVITTGLVLAVAGCGSGDNGKSAASSPVAKTTRSDAKGQSSPAPEQDKVLAEVKGGDDVTLTVVSALRDSGGFLTVNGKVTNGSGKFWNPAQWAGDEQELAGNSASMAGASLVDVVGKKKYLVLRDTQGRCLCTRFTGGFDANEAKTFYAQFPAPPASTKSVEFQIGDMPPATIDITDGQ